MQCVEVTMDPCGWHMCPPGLASWCQHSDCHTSHVTCHTSHCHCVTHYTDCVTLCHATPSLTSLPLEAAGLITRTTEQFEPFVADWDYGDSQTTPGGSAALLAGINYKPWRQCFPNQPACRLSLMTFAPVHLAYIVS